MAAPQALRAPICADRVRAHFSPNEAVQSLVEHCDRPAAPFDIVCAHAAAIGASALPAAAFVKPYRIFPAPPRRSSRELPRPSTAPPPTAAVSVLHVDWRHSGPCLLARRSSEDLAGPLNASASRSAKAKRGADSAMMPTPRTFANGDEEKFGDGPKMSCVHRGFGFGENADHRAVGAGPRSNFAVADIVPADIAVAGRPSLGIPNSLRPVTGADAPCAARLCARSLMRGAGAHVARRVSAQHAMTQGGRRRSHGRD